MPVIRTSSGIAYTVIPETGHERLSQDIAQEMDQQSNIIPLKQTGLEIIRRSYLLQWNYAKFSGIGYKRFGKSIQCSYNRDVPNRCSYIQHLLYHHLKMTKYFSKSFRESVKQDKMICDSIFISLSQI